MPPSPTTAPCRHRPAISAYTKSTRSRRQGPLPGVRPRLTLCPAQTIKRVESEMAQADSVTPVGVNHVVLNVRDIEESHRFWTEIVGLKQVSELRPRPEMPNMPKMRFYSGDHGGKFTHHDVALVE